MRYKLLLLLLNVTFFYQKLRRTLTKTLSLGRRWPQPIVLKLWKCSTYILQKVNFLGGNFSLNYSSLNNYLKSLDIIEGRVPFITTLSKNLLIIDTVETCSIFTTRAILILLFILACGKVDHPIESLGLYSKSRCETKIR